MLLLQYINDNNFIHITGQRGRDCMVVGFTTTCAIGAYHHYSCECEPRSWQVYPIQHYVLKFFATGQLFSPDSSTNKTYHHDITEILLKVALNTINQPNQT